MRTTLVIAAIAATASCSLYTEDPVLTDRPDATPTDAHPPGPDAELGACGVAPHCPAPSGNRVSLCGQIVDTETGAPIVGDAWSGAGCDPDAPTATGPCALRIRFLDALGFAANPEGTSPLPASEIEILDCGEFRGIGVERPFSGLLAIVIDSAPGAATERVPTAVTLATDMAERRAGIRAFATARSTVAAWTDTAGAPFGAQSFAERGVYVPIFRYAGAPVAGVKITAGGEIRAASDFYFDDADAKRTNIDAAQAATGPNGAGLLVDTTLGGHSGRGAEPPGCEWPFELGASVPGAVWVSIRDAHVLGNDDEPCP